VKKTLSLVLMVALATVAHAWADPLTEDMTAAIRGMALVVLPGPITIAHRELITALAARHRLPAAYAFRFFVTGGGLLSYGIDSADQSRQAAG
jgi:hypothetical protein